MSLLQIELRWKRIFQSSPHEQLDFFLEPSGTILLARSSPLVLVGATGLGFLFFCLKELVTTPNGLLTRFCSRLKDLSTGVPSLKGMLLISISIIWVENTIDQGFIPQIHVRCNQVRQCAICKYRRDWGDYSAVVIF